MNNPLFPSPLAAHPPGDGPAIDIEAMRQRHEAICREAAELYGHNTERRYFHDVRNIGAQAHFDRAALLADRERLEAEIGRLHSEIVGEAQTSAALKIELAELQARVAALVEHSAHAQRGVVKAAYEDAAKIAEADNPNEWRPQYPVEIAAAIRARAREIGT